MKKPFDTETKHVRITLDETMVAPLLPAHMTVVAQFYPLDGVPATQVLLKLALCILVDIVSSAVGIGPDTAIQAIVASPEMQSGILAVCGVIVSLPELPSVPGFPFNLGELYVAHQRNCGPDGEIAMLRAVASGAAHLDLSPLPRNDQAAAAEALQTFSSKRAARKTADVPFKNGQGETIN